MIAERRQMAGRSRGDLAGDAAEALLNQLAERPACAVTGQHGEVVQVDIAAAVCVGNFFVVNFRQPVVCCDGTGVAQNQTADGVGDGGIFFHAPVGRLHIAVDQLFIVQNGGTHIADLFPLLAVEDKRLGDVGISGLYKNVFNAVLNIFHGDEPMPDFRLKVRCDLQGQ